MRIVVLGSGAALPSPERNPASIALRYNGEVYLFDCGEGAQRQMMKSKISYSKTKYILITHLHDDHILGIPGLIFTLSLEDENRKEKVRIVGPKGTLKRIGQLIGKELQFVEIEEIDEGWSVDIGDAVIYAFRTKHFENGVSLGYVFEEKDKIRFNKKKCEQLGIKGTMFKILENEKEIKLDGKTIKLEDVTYSKKGRKIVVSGDTAFSENTIKHAKGADILLHEATYLEDRREDADRYFHSTVSDACRIGIEAGVKNLVLYHFSNRYSDEKEILKEAKEYLKEYLDQNDYLRQKESSPTNETAKIGKSSKMQLYIAYDGMELKI